VAGNHHNSFKIQKRIPMLKILISLMLGPFGLKVQEWYIQNSLLVNSFVLAYGIVLIISYINYKKILDHTLNILEKSKKEIRSIDNQNFWASAIDEASFFPLISGSVSLIPKKTSPNKILQLTMKDKRWNEIISEIKDNKENA